MPRVLRAPLRLLLGMLVLTTGLAHLKLAGWRGAPLPQRTRLGRRWARSATRRLGLRVETRGRTPERPGVIVANHRSYADILALLGSVDCTFLAKVEVARWPIFGALARTLDTVFVERDCKESRRDSRRRLVSLAETGARVALFPEGTTSRGPGMLAFQPGMFWSAARRSLPVVPVALHYDYDEDAWVDDDTLLGHFLSRFSRAHVRVRVEFGPALESDDGETLRRAAEAWIAAALERERPSSPADQTTSPWKGATDAGHRFVPYRVPLPTGPLTLER